MSRVRKMDSNFFIKKDYSLVCSLSHNLMAGYVAQNWNTILPSLLLTHKKLEELRELNSS